MDTRRLSHFAAMVLIGDGIMAIVRPARDAQAWNVGPKRWRKLMGCMSNRPTLTRCVGIAQVVGGILWATREEKILEQLAIIVRDAIGQAGSMHPRISARPSFCGFSCNQAEPGWRCVGVTPFDSPSVPTMMGRNSLAADAMAQCLSARMDCSPAMPR